jgi:hypothetical protein
MEELPVAKTIVGLYDTFDHARGAVEGLVDVGVDRERISLVAHDPDEQYSTPYAVRDPDADLSEEGAVGGGAAGAILGGIVGLAVAPFFAFGPLAGALIGGGVGAASGGLAGGLVGAGLEERDAQVYAEGVRRGGTLVMVDASDEMTDDTVRVMNQHNPVDIDQRAAHWRDSGWTGYDPDAELYSPAEAEEERARILRLGEEMRSSGGRTADRPGARVHNRSVESRAEDEIDVRNRMFHTDIGGDALSESQRADFQRHYQETFSDGDLSYEEYEPAYAHGYTAGISSVQHDREWEEVEPEIRQRWQSEPDNHAWNDVKNAAIYGWRSARDTDQPAID